MMMQMCLFLEFPRTQVETPLELKKNNWLDDIADDGNLTITKRLIMPVVQIIPYNWIQLSCYAKAQANATTIVKRGSKMGPGCR